ncbi:Crp/Fnr family transcriptional regulator [Chenggangzhangella methanolivorans]|uniref:Crp/Fnr family transcriptional regulator n=1 Tax=Chenggangzhangella methanolivorans TaxID=1437009 RepID=UPI0021BD7FB2|nr:cyclic nucleotide-binding domain-containing protein [Chenggangzhangella methanolivorans]
MATQAQVDRWEAVFPFIREMSEEDRALALRSVHFPTLDADAIAYELDGDCANYLMCLDGRTRVFRRSENGREVLIYKVTSGGTCVLTTQCLLSGSNFPAESVAEAKTELAAIPASVFSELMGRSAPFRTFVLQDYSKLLSGMFSIVDEVSFATLEQKLARRLLVEADDEGFVAKPTSSSPPTLTASARSSPVTSANGTRGLGRQPSRQGRDPRPQGAGLTQDGLRPRIGSIRGPRSEPGGQGREPVGRGLDQRGLH